MWRHSPELGGNTARRSLERNGGIDVLFASEVHSSSSARQAGLSLALSLSLFLHALVFLNLFLSRLNTIHHLAGNNAVIGKSTKTA